MGVDLKDSTRNETCKVYNQKYEQYYLELEWDQTM